MFLSKAKAIKSAKANASSNNITINKIDNTTSKKISSIPSLLQYIESRDYMGALTLIEFELNHPNDKTDKKLLTLWLAFTAFHIGDYRKALDIYNTLILEYDADPTLYLYIACCQYHLGLYKDANLNVHKGPQTRLKVRLMMHISQKLNDEQNVITNQSLLTDTPEDLLSVAALQYSKGQYQSATEIYKKILTETRDAIALNVYLALCYYKLDYYEVSLEILNPYMAMYPDSGLGANLKACNAFRLHDGLAAEMVLKPLLDIMAASPHNFENDLVSHNLVVFRGGENALSVFPQLVEVLPEARLNLVIYYLRQGELQLAYNQIKDLEPSTPPEYVLKGVVHAALVSQSTAVLDHSKLAQQFFHLIGNSASECDTIPGRQCMASCYFLMGEFKDVLVYLKSIQSFFSADASFNFNHGVALAQTGSWSEALEAFLNVNNEYFKQEYSYIAWLSKCFIMTGRAKDAWELYVRMETSNDSITLLNLIAHTSYKVGSFYYAAKAFDLLERMEPAPEYTDGKLGACAGVFQMVIAGKLKKDCLRDLNIMLRSSIGLRDAEMMQIVIKNWIDENDD